MVAYRLAKLQRFFEAVTAGFHQLIAAADTHAFFFKLHNGCEDVGRTIEQGAREHRSINPFECRVSLVLPGCARGFQPFSRCVDTGFCVMKGTTR